jgi:pimeloyl-ACP methyl ester carboxylesterase
MRILLLALALLTASAPASFGQDKAAPFRLAPYKDELFAYQKILETGYDGDFLKVEYDRPRDLYQRDVEDGLKVDPKYVSLDTDAVQANLELTIGGTSIKYVGVGATAGGAKAIVVFVHGRGTDRFSGVNDWIHGGNFNRIKNMMMLNGGVYLSPSFPDFEAKGADTVAALVLHYAALSPGAPVILACGSWGAKICWRLIRDPGVGPLVTGLMLFDADTSESFVETAKTLPPDQRLPIHVSNSMGDKIIGWRSQQRFFRAIKEAVPDYPVRFTLFSAGTHGISLRMTDWRLAINWILASRDGMPMEAGRAE